MKLLPGLGRKRRYGFPESAGAPPAHQAGRRPAGLGRTPILPDGFPKAYVKLVGRVCLFMIVAGLIQGALSAPVGASWIRGTDAVPLADERSLSASPHAPYRIVFYDNTRYPVTSENALPVAVWAHPDFSPLIAVDANPWVGVSVLRAASAESAVSDRVYANVQLKLILEEYERMQRRAREVLDGLGLNLLSGSMAPPFPGTPIPMPRSPATPQTATPASGEESVEAKLARLRSAYRRAASDAADAVSSEGESPSAMFLAMTGSPSGAVSGGPDGTRGPSGSLSRAGSTGSGGSTPSASGGTGGVYGTPAPSFTGSPEWTRVPPDLGPALIPARTLDDDEPLPWVFRAALAAVRFVFSHKVEILATCVFFFVLFWVLAVVVTAKTKRKRG